MSQEMSRDLQPPCIFVLRHDILLHIFHLNTHDAENEYSIGSSIQALFRPIVTARFTSQVCRFWRQVILESPAIWGSLIDMSIADTKSDQWAKEVMKRAGRAPLLIYGAVRYTRRSRLFFTSLLENHWDRVCRLDVWLTENADLMDKSIWDVLWDRTAPNLQKFILRVFPGSPMLLETKNDPLFFDHAPSLRRLHCQQLNRHVNPKLSWMSQLASLTLSDPLKTIDILRILSQTVQLESLVITNTALDLDVAAITWSEKIRLPNLMRIVMERNTVRGSILCLKHIIPKPSCALVFNSEFKYKQDGLIVGATEQPPDIMFDLKVLISYIASYFNLQKATTLTVCHCL